MPTVTENWVFTGQTTLSGPVSLPAASVGNTQFNTSDPIARSKLFQDTLQKYVIPMTQFRVWDAMQTLLPGTSSADDLALIGGAFSVNTPMLKTSDMKTLGAVTRYARALFALPPEYDDGQTVQIRLRAGMQTTVADTAATCDVQVYESDKAGGVSADLVTTAATDCNSLTLADKDFDVTATDLVKGDLLDIRIALLVNDAASGTAVTGAIGSVEVLLDIRG